MTAQDRAAERAAKKRRKRRKYFADKARESRNGREGVQHACRFAYAVSENELDDEGRRELAREIALATDRVAAKWGGHGS
jgi:hypothetical protein